LIHSIISDEKDTIFFGADIFPTLAHLQVPWVMACDIEPIVTIKEKMKLLNLVQKNN
tara:strand:- start:124 stop:294 length:171 start_codon:yes stop_codon:yes gene_type:complete